MSRYQVILRGYLDATSAGEEAFLLCFGQVYQKTPEEARQWLQNYGGRVYVFEERSQAEEAAQFLESLGGRAKVVEKTLPREEEAVPAASLSFPQREPSLSVWTAGMVIKESFRIFFQRFGTLMALELLLIQAPGALSVAYLLRLAADWDKDTRMLISDFFFLACLPGMLYTWSLSWAAQVVVISETFCGQKSTLRQSCAGWDGFCRSGFPPQ